ncbi:MAG: S9 family peptidase [Gemmatimonadetes bacterium]|nr:S9 family peptidase [Gemmatimonadota bacterium]
MTAGIPLPEHLDALTDPAGNLRRVDGMTSLQDGTLVVLLTGEGRTNLYRLPPGGEQLLPMPRVDDGCAVWAAGARVLIQAEGNLILVDEEDRQSILTVLPAATQSVAAAWSEDGLHVAAIVDEVEVDGEEECIAVYPAQRGTVALMTWASEEGWIERLRIPSGCNGLAITRDGQRLAWCEPLNVVPEEADRGEFRGYCVARDELTQFTQGAGQAGEIRVRADGRGVLYRANFSLERPITTHTDLWWQEWGSDQPVKLTGGERAIDRFGWCNDDESVWATIVEGTRPVTRIFGLDGSERRDAWQGGAATSEVCWLGDDPAFETEDRQTYPRIQVGARWVEIPQPEAFDEFRCQVHQWTATDGTVIEGVVWETTQTEPHAPLLVRAHGGPAGDVVAVRSTGVAYRHLLGAGYRLFLPAFRGSLGFGDDFLGANIRCQGIDDLDDIVTGIDYLATQGLADPARVGIFGGSYGGYMTIRALAVSDRFCVGVASYGFLDNRWMTLETGDFTYEDEYFGPVTWPRQQVSAVSDVFPHLGQIDAPLLLMHGKEDPICPWGQSLVAYRALAARDAAAALVVYPGEGHGFRDSGHQRDAARRTLAWFLEHLAP